MRQELLLDGLAPHGPRRDHHAQGAQVPVPRLGVEGGDERSGERVAHDDEAIHLLSLDRIEQLDRVVLAMLEQDDPSALGQDHVGGEATGAVHERTGRQQREVDAGGRHGLAHGVEPTVDRVPADPAGDQAGEQVVLAPHDTLGHAGGPAGVEHEQVIAAASPGRRGAGRSRLGRFLVGRGPVRAGARAVVDPEPAADGRDPIHDPLDALGEGPVEDDRHRVGVLPEVTELVVGVAVVGVDRDQPDLEGGEERLQVLGAVVEIEGHLVLLDHAQVQQVSGHTVGPAVELGPADVARPLGHRDGVGLDIGHDLPYVPVVPVGHCPAPRRPVGAGWCRCLVGRVWWLLVVPGAWCRARAWCCSRAVPAAVSLRSRNGPRTPGRR